MIETSSLEVFRGSSSVCRNIDLCAGRGHVVGLLGPNGSGKSSLLAGLRGRLKVRGHIDLLERPLPEYSPAELARTVACMPQVTELAFSFTVLELALLGRSPYLKPWQAYRAQDRELASEVLERLGLTDLADRPVMTLSGGERRRAYLARALVQETPILFLDEPTAGLDPAAQEGLVEIIQQLKSEDRQTLVVALHDVPLAHRLCDWIVGLKNGELLFQGPAAEVMIPSNLEALYDVEWSKVSTSDREVLFVLGRTGRV